MNKVISQRRKELGLTLRELSQEVGVSASFLSQVESGKTSPSLKTLTKIANALDFTIGKILGEVDSINLINPIIHESDRKVFKNLAHGVELQYLSSFGKEYLMEPCIHKLSTNTAYGDPPFKHYGQEFIYLLSGKIEVLLHDKELTMARGDSLYFDSNTLHSFKNTGEEEAVFLCVSTPPHK